MSRIALCASFAMSLLSIGAIAAESVKIDSTLPKRVETQVEEKATKPLHIDRSSPIVFSRSELKVTIKEKIPVPDDEVKKDEEKTDSKEKPAEEKAQQFREETKEAKYMVDVKSADVFLNDEAAYIDTAAYTEKTGILVIFPKHGKHVVPLNNMQSQTDFVFMDRQGRITELFPGVVPGSVEEIRNSVSSYALLIITDGQIAKNGMKLQDVISHKSLDMPPEMIEITGPGGSKQKSIYKESPIIFNSNR